MNGKRLCIIVWLMSLLPSLQAQEKPSEWDLKACLDYARQQNIQIRKSRIAWEESVENTKEAKAQRLPSLSFSTAHNYTNRPMLDAGDKNAYTGSYDLSASMTLYQGGELKKNLQQMNIRNRVQELSVEESENNIELAITQAYIQVLYADEAVKVAEATVEVSKAQRDRGEELKEVGSISKADMAQLESQYASDKYQLVVAQTTLDNARLDLKQLLELGISDEMVLVIPVLEDEDVLAALPSKESVYAASLEVMPEVEYNRLNVQLAGIEKEKARAGYLPSLRLSAGVGTSHASGSSWGSQMKDNWSENIGLTLSVPIFSNRSVKTSVNLASLGIEDAELEYENVKKNLLTSVETVYQDAVSSQNRFRSAQESLKAAELSFDLTQQQFNLGMKNTVEMLTEKNNLVAAQLELLQAKYMAVLNCQLLNFYEGKEIEL